MCTHIFGDGVGVGVVFLKWDGLWDDLCLYIYIYIYIYTIYIYIYRYMLPYIYCAFVVLG